MSRIATWALAGLVAVQLLVGAAWSIENAGDFPRYEDTRDYLRLSRSLLIPPERGWLYPHAIRRFDRSRGVWREIRDWSWVPRSDRPYALEALEFVQGFQLLVCLAALIYFVTRLVEVRGASTAERRAPGLLAAMLFFDPIVSHFNLAVLTDSLSLSASLVFCAALADLGRGRRTVLAAALLVGSQALAAGLRPEKNAIMLATAFGSVLAWAWVRRRSGTPASWGRSALVLSLALATGVGSLALQRSLQTGSSDWSFRDTILHQRIIFPHLGEVFDSLSPETRRRITRSGAERYDRRINAARHIVDRASGGRPEVRGELTAELADAVIAQRGPSIALDTLADAAENALPSVSFYARLAAAWWLGTRNFSDRARGDGALWTRENLARAHPRLSEVHLLLGALLLAGTGVAALAALRARSELAATGPHPAVGIVWVPVAMFAALNALAFAAVQDLVLIRYTLFAHVAGLLLLYSGALCWSLRGRNARVFDGGEAARVHSSPETRKL